MHIFTMQIHYPTSCYNQQANAPGFPFDPLETIEQIASANAVVIFSMSTCYMCHAVKRLFSNMGVNAAVYEIDENISGKELEEALKTMLGGASSSIVPAVFIGGKLIGNMDRVMAAHINGNLVPLLKDAGALWL